jgi:hypothetical protein
MEVYEYCFYVYFHPYVFAKRWFVFQHVTHQEKLRFEPREFLQFFF